MSGGGGLSGEGSAAGNPGRAPSDLIRPAALAEAAALGLSALAGVVAGAQEGIIVVDAERRFVYANPAACQMLGCPLEQLRGRDFLVSIPAREHAIMLARFSEQLGGSVGVVPAPFTCSLRGPDGAEREIVYSQFAVDVAGSPHGVAIFQDLTGPRAASRTAMALAQTAAQLVGAGTTDKILAGIARHAVEGTRALVCGIATVDDDHKIASVGAHVTPGYALPPSGETRAAAWDTFADVSGEKVVEAMTAGSIVIGEAPGRPVVLTNARSEWEANPVTQAFAATLNGLDWQAGVYVPLSWESHVFGLLGVYLPAGVAGPSEAELAFYTALADQAAVAVSNARLTSQARQAATSLERNRLARELHDSVSQGLFSMTMHARAAQLSMAKAGLDQGGPLGRSIAELAELTRGALAEMRALIFELRPAALAEEGLVAALRKQAAALSAREQVVITVDGPEERLDLAAGVEEHLYRIASEALHNVVRHSGADGATVSVKAEAGGLRVEVRDDGAGFDPGSEHPGHLGLLTMVERAQTIGAELAVMSTPGEGTTVSVSLPEDRRDQGTAGPVRRDQARAATGRGRKLQPSAAEGSAASGGRGQPAQGGTSDQPGRRVAPDLTWSSALADAAALGVSALAGVLAGAQEGITVCDADRRFVYANPAACEMLGHPLEQLGGRDFLSVIPAGEHNFALGRFAERLARSIGEAAAPFTGVWMDSEGAEREIVCCTFAIDIAGGQHGVTILRDVTDTRAAARAAVALAQAASELVGAGTTDEILAGIARHAAEGTRALDCGISAVGEDHKLAEAGGYSPRGAQCGEARSAGWIAPDEVPYEEVIEALTGGWIVIGEPRGKPVVLPNARFEWEANPVTKGFAAPLNGLDWQAGVCVPLSWENRVFGLFVVYLPAGVPAPSEAELAFYTALTDQAAVAVTNARLASQATQAATLLERGRLARELHDSVSQALFSMTMHARAAQLAMANAGLDEGGPLGRSIAELAELTRGAMAEMRALIFELRPEALAEEGLVAALRKQAAALTAREETVITVQGPEERLEVSAGVEEHLYRIVSEALYNVVNHARAGSATVSVSDRAGGLRVEVSDHGAGFDPDSEHPGHLGLLTMVERAETIGAELVVASAPGKGTTVMLSLAHDRRDQGKAAPDAR